MRFDLRHRTAHASSGRFPERGTAANLPSGEAYIVPYEGEQGEPSLTAGRLPVQIKDEIVLFEVRANRAIAVEGSGAGAAVERDHLRREPAYGNMAELGFGVLADFGLSPIGEILLDEKLGLHVAFGRSDHFGGITGPSEFSSPAEVIHLDRIYIPAAQPRVRVVAVDFAYPDGSVERILENGGYRIF
jgi:leucyl aminopeptidase (aminopeptidase T)